MESLLRVYLLLPLLLGALAVPSSTQKQVSQVRGGRPAGWSGDRPGRQVYPRPRPPPPPPSPPPLLSPAPLLHTRPPPADLTARIKRSLTRHAHRLHSPSHRRRRFRSTHRGAPPQTRSLRRPRTRPGADRRAKNNRGLKKTRRKKVISARRPDVVGDAARASYVLSDTADTDGQAGLTEPPYPSPSFVRPSEQGQVFRHYNDFDHHPGQDGGNTAEGEAGSPLNQAALRSRASRQTGVIDSDTILKDGQIFHRHDAREERNGINRGQSRRRHARPGDQQLLFDEVPHREVGQRGVTDPVRFFSAEALNSGGQSQTRVSGNMHGVDGSAVTLSGGKITQAGVTLGENSSSMAHITDHQGADDPILASTVGAGQRGGAADARARAPDAATTHAQIEFSPADYDEAALGEHGTASALLTPNGESTLATLGGQASSGSYLGTAHSSTLQDHHYLGQNGFVQLPYDDALVQPPYDHGQVQPLYDDALVQPHYDDVLVHLPYDDALVQPPYDNGQVQLPYDNDQAQPSHGNGQVQPPNDSGQALTPYDSGQVQPLYDDALVQPPYGSGQAQPPYDNGQVQPSQDNGQVQPPYDNGQAPPPYDSGQAQSPYDNGQVQPHYDDALVQAPYDSGQVQPPYDNSQVQSPYDNGQVQHTFESGNMSQGLMDMSDMLSSIMETVHQPHMLPEVAALPTMTPHLTPQGTKLIDMGGMVGGSGAPPQESEIGQVSQHLYQEQEGDGRQVTPPAAGQVGIATYFQELGAPPNGSDLTGSLLEEYPYDPSTYYDYPTDHESSYLDLDPKIFSVELDLDALYPTPAPALHQPHPDLTSHAPVVVHQIETTTPDLPPHASDSLDPNQVPPETPDHFQTPDQPHTPQITDQTLTPGLPHTPDRPHVPDYPDTPAQPPVPGQPYTSDPLPPHIIPDYSRTPDHIPDYSDTPHHIPDYSDTPHHIPDYYDTPHQIPDYSHTPDQPQTPDHHIPHQSSVPTSFSSPQLPHTSDPIPAQPPTPDQTTSQRVTNEPQSPRPSDTRVTAETVDRSSAGTEVTPMPMGVPIVPGQPGSAQMLPNGDDGPDLNVITMPINQRMDMSMMRPRPGTPIQPGEKIPGAPGYRVPAGFRGHVILGHSLPIKANSRHVAEGFNTQVRLTPQSPASDAVFAAVSGPQASQPLTSEGGVPGVHVTLGGGGDRHQQYRAPDPHVASTGGHTGRDRHTLGQGNPWYGTDSRQWSSNPTARHREPSHRDPSSATRENGWQNGRGRPSTTGSWNQRRTSLPSKSWNGRQSSPQKNGRQCAYITIVCKVAVNDLGNGRQCRPSFTTRDCCC